MKFIEDKPNTRSEKAWDGYTLEELRYERIAMEARIDTQRDILEAGLDRVRSGNIFLNKNTFSKVLSMINYTDFMVIGFKLMRRIFPLFKKK
ncbi:MAG: hypothetical protein K2M19_05270 [Muribaculaceae bacterium]|nr:hypothetical protein [Muribaculaceae bacterium]